MRIQHHIKFNAVFLLLAYLISNSPSILYHHHSNEITAYEKATTCEIAIYYYYKENTCNHKNHIAKAVEKCALCDNHTVSLHTFQTPAIHYLRIELSRNFVSSASNFDQHLPSNIFNKGPPLSSSFNG